MKQLILRSIATTSILTAAPALAADWFIEAGYESEAQLQSIAGEFQHLIIDRDRRTIRVDTDDDGVAALRQAGLDVNIDVIATAQMRQLMQGDGIASIPGYACYRTVEETRDTIDQLVAGHPDRATVENIGPSWEKTRNATAGYEIRALQVTNLATAVNDPDRPRVVFLGSIHAREYTPAELLTRFAEWLLNGYGNDAQATWLVDHVDFRFILHANPDGRKKAETGLSWRKNTNNVTAPCASTTSSSHAGIDLNRNFPFHWNGTGGTGSSGTLCSATYRGPSAGSEPETQNLVRYVAGTRDGSGVYGGGVLPDRRGEALVLPAPEDYSGLFFDIHSYSKLVLWPWGDVSGGTANNAAMTALGRRLAWFNGYTPQQSIQLYATDGTTIDTIYAELGAPSYTIELGVAFFESCTTFANETLPQNFAALKYAARAARRPYQLPLGPDAQGITVTPVVEAGQPITVTATIDDSRFRTTTPAQPIFPITAANAFFDLPPWHADAIAIPLTAVDGTFDGPIETVTASLPTTGLAPGKHLLYVQGINNQTTGGRPGTPDAMFFTVLPPNDPIFGSGFDSP